ncbi:MAG: SDR family oxidoreductase [Lachnospiraceae bacterium]|nr:SDR family oxidoreductase [Lachnospiraceae bacterium]
MVAIVTGASSGFGYEVCKQLVEKGYKVYGISRRELAPVGVTAYSADVSDESAVRTIVDAIALKEGRIDLLIANAGMGISGPVELTTEETARRIMDVNFFGQIYVTQAVLPYMRKQKKGTIVFVSSVGAPIALPYQAFYSASKSAVNSVALALRNEAREYGIHVTAVMPGDASTGFTDARIKHSDSAVKKADDESSLYPGSNNAVASMEKDERNGISPKRVAAVIVRAACKKNPAPLYVAGFKYRILLSLYNILPTRIAVWLVGKFYLRAGK